MNKKSPAERGFFLLVDVSGCIMINLDESVRLGYLFGMVNFDTMK